MKRVADMTAEELAQFEAQQRKDFEEMIAKTPRLTPHFRKRSSQEAYAKLRSR